MKIKAINNEAKKIINTVFKYVKNSNDKILWKKSIIFINQKINKLKKLRTEVIYTEKACSVIRELWIWESVRKQIIKKFGKKFICKNIQMK